MAFAPPHKRAKGLRRTRHEERMTMQSKHEKAEQFVPTPPKPRTVDSKPPVQAFDPYFPQRPVRSGPTEAVRYSPFRTYGRTEGF